MRRLVLPVFAGLMFAVSVSGEGPVLPKITLGGGEWGEGNSESRLAVCNSVSQEFLGLFGDRRWDPIILTRWDRTPLVQHGTVGGSRLVFVNAQGLKWDKLAYQFSHECCHIACNYRVGDNSNLWFEESLCEAASFFTLRRMAVTWRAAPPYQNWVTYSVKLEEYATQVMETFEVDGKTVTVEKLEDRTLADWYREHEADLRKDPINRPLNKVVAIALLPLLERHPENWRAVSYLNLQEKRPLPFREYLQEWHDAAPENEQKFVVEVAKLFEIELANR